MLVKINTSIVNLLGLVKSKTDHQCNFWTIYQYETTYGHLLLD